LPAGHPSNITTPLLGAVRTGVVGIFRSRAYRRGGAGLALFNFVFWGFGFLRMGTTGFTAQRGRRRHERARATFLRSLMRPAHRACSRVLQVRSISRLAFSCKAAPRLKDYPARIRRADLERAGGSGQLRHSRLVLGTGAHGLAAGLRFALTESTSSWRSHIVLFSAGHSGRAAATLTSEILTFLGGLALVSACCRRRDAPSLRSPSILRLLGSTATSCATLCLSRLRRLHPGRRQPGRHRLRRQFILMNLLTMSALASTVSPWRGRSWWAAPGARDRAGFARDPGFTIGGASAILGRGVFPFCRHQ